MQHLKICVAIKMETPAYIIFFGIDILLEWGIERLDDKKHNFLTTDIIAKY